MRHLGEDAGAVARVGFGVGGTTVLQAGQRLEAMADGLVGRSTVQVRDETDATCVVFIRRVIQALGDGQASAVQTVQHNTLRVW